MIEKLISDVQHHLRHLVVCTTGVITLTSCTADEYSSVEIAPERCGPHALALFEDPESSPGQVVAAKQSQLKQIVKKFDLYVPAIVQIVVRCLSVQGNLAC